MQKLNKQTLRKQIVHDLEKEVALRNLTLQSAESFSDNTNEKPAEIEIINKSED